jgi:hypothetical protein
MALADLENFVVERLRVLDENQDLTPGSPADVQVIQPLLRRLGSDPFTIDLGTFLQEKLNQEFPELATKEGDAITDLLIKTAMVLWDPIVRENQRIRNSLSFRDPSILTTDEAEALGANLFATRNTGDLARGPARIYFAAPQSLSVTPANFISSKSGLRYFPTEIQSIRVEEMLFNREAELYYFDVSVIAREAGDHYNIGPDELVTIANLTSAVRITNKVRFRSGVPEESAVEFIDRIEQELSERSLVTLRGIVAKLTKAFPELTRLGVVGAGEAAMNRDILQGGGLGAIVAGGVTGASLPDGENKLTTRRLHVAASDADFSSLIGPIGPVTGHTLTVHLAYPPGSLPLVRDLTVVRVVDGQTLDVAEQVLKYDAVNAPWVLRRQELTLSGIPGGLLFPNTPEGAVRMPDNQVHIGGATDVYVRGTDFDSASLVLSAIVDDSPVLSGRRLTTLTTTTVTLTDLAISTDLTGTLYPDPTNYARGDATYLALEVAAIKGFSLQILDPPNAGSYRVLLANQDDPNPVLTITPALTVVGGDFRWRLLDILDLDLAEPKETKVAGSDMFSIQGVDYFDTESGIDFASFGVGPKDVIRIYTGSVAADYTVKQVLTPLFRRVQVDRPLGATLSHLRFAIFRENAEGGMKMPLVRIDTIDLLDTSAQPVGSTIPYAKPIDIETRAFANVAHGVKADVTDALLGIVGLDLGSSPSANVDGLTLSIEWDGFSFIATFVGTNPLSLAEMIDQVNAASPQRIAVAVGKRFALLPIAPNMAVSGGTARVALFGADLTYRASDVRSETLMLDWTVPRPPIDGTFDVVQVLDGLQVGFYETPTPEAGQLHTSHDFFPEAGRHVQVGSRSIGSVRCYFLEPTTIEFGRDSVFTLTGMDGSVLRYFPDPTVNYQRIPALPTGVKPKDGVVVSGSHVLTTASVDFIAKGIQQGDELVIDYQPITGTLALADPVPNLSTKTLLLSIDGSSDKAVTFICDDPTISTSAVTRAGVADQINRIVGQIICKITGTSHLEFEADASIIVRASGTANALLGFSTTADANDTAVVALSYEVLTVDTNQISIVNVFSGFSGTASRLQFKVFRKAVQRICSTDMSKKVGTAGLYYFDVELVSEGTGDRYNIDAGLPMSATGFASDGYFLTTDDPNLTFSELERPRLRLSRSILEVGVSDDPDNATQLSGQNIQVNYDRSSLAANVQSFASSETERVINESILARHLIPYFVRFDLSYLGGSKETEVVPDIEKYIKGLDPSDTLEVGALEKILSNRGATSITNPVDLIAVIHNVDRSITVERSQDRLNTGALAAFIPDLLNVTRKLG